MARQRAAARKAWAGSGEAATEALWFEVRERVVATEFLGYDAEEAEGQIVALVVDGKEVQQASADGVLGQEVMLVTNQTPFYGESGGQQGDRGAAFSADGGEMEVHDTQKKLGDLHVHRDRKSTRLNSSH